MRLTLLQTDIAYADPEANLKKMLGLIKKSMNVENKPDVIVLPEMWNTSFAMEELDKLADNNGSPCGEAVAELAERYQVNIVAGSIADKREGKIYNTSYVFDRQGATIAMYDKVHLFGLMKEPEYLTPGKKRTVFEIDGIKCGLVICYDIRFPELARAIALDGAKILFVPAQFPYPRHIPWNFLIPSRAIENQMFVVGVNRVGKEGKATFFGHSMVVEPRGDVIINGSEEEEEILSADIDIEKVDISRNYLTCLQDRVPAVYRR
ncbi:MAG: carbon-nitrogen hydrolase [Firmicutes bacterium HGW-Firmicutes-12]|jgi:predicted amidohydrolase|nr:MAG: carbon-nitrogen hydrolase [Firmicutes bacterium HGW-Firmicutes-12]